jgi:hypothetical protein
MTKFIVSLDETIRLTCVIEAESLEQAKEKGYNILMNAATGAIGEIEEESLGSENFTVMEA